MNATPFDGINNNEFTFIHIDRYTGNNRKRIWQGIGTNYLSGFHESKKNRYFQQGWISEEQDLNDTKWQLTVDQNVSKGGKIKQIIMNLLMII